MIPYKGYKPKIDKTAYVAMHTTIAGKVTIGRNSSIWFGSVLRGDLNTIEIGNSTNIQDNSTIHMDHDTPVKIGDNVTVGHNCILHGCTVQDNVIVGMGATILDGAVISRNSIVGANSLVTSGKVYPEGMLILGSPAKAVRELTEQEIAKIQANADEYVMLAKEFMQ